MYSGIFTSLCWGIIIDINYIGMAFYIIGFLNPRDSSYVLIFFGKKKYPFKVLHFNNSENRNEAVGTCLGPKLVLLLGNYGDQLHHNGILRNWIYKFPIDRYLNKIVLLRFIN